VPEHWACDADNDFHDRAQEFAERIHFAHLRGTRSEADGKSFHEAEHLGSDLDMVAIAKALLAAEKIQGAEIPFRPDHGHQMLDDLGKDTNPGYSGIGRLKGLAELRGVIAALEHNA